MAVQSRGGEGAKQRTPGDSGAHREDNRRGDGTLSHTPCDP